MLISAGFTSARSFAPVVPPADVYDLDFTAGADATALAAAGFAFGRASTGWDENRTAYATNVPVITPSRGLRIEQAASNAYIQSNTPATRTVALAAGSFTLWCLGTGSVALTGAASGTATAAAPLAFTLAAAGSVTVTPSGSPSFVEIEDGLYPTTPIVTTTAAVTRATASCIATGRAGLGQGTVLLRVRSARGAASVAQVAWQVDDGTNTNRFKVDRGSSDQLRLVVTSAGTNLASLSSGTFADDTVINILAAWDATGFVFRSPLGADQTTATAPTTGVARETIGISAGSASPWNGAIERVARWSTRLAPLYLDVLLASGGGGAAGSSFLTTDPAGDHALVDAGGDRILIN